MQRARLESLFDALPDIARRAGDAIMEIYRSDFAVRGKADRPLVTGEEAARALDVTRGVEEAIRTG